MLKTLFQRPPKGYRVVPDLGDGTYYNPILNADYSDPDIVRYENTYYMISSTIQLSPGMAILASSDLVNWRTVNYVFENVKTLDPNLNWDKMDSYGLGIYAGSLRYLEWMENGTKKHKWFVHTTILNRGIIVATAADILGKWDCQFMKDINGNPILAPGWVDNCPYWEFNNDGTLKAAYMIASKSNGAWYTHLFQMSLNGTQLLDGDLYYMSMHGDFARRRVNGEVVNRISGEIIPTSKTVGDAAVTQMNESGEIASILYAEHIPYREGTVIRDIVTAEASKIIRFDNTAIGNMTFCGRHGKNQKAKDYIYIFNSEVWEKPFRFPVLHRAKSIYGDKFDSSGKYIGPGTPSNPGSYETQRLIINITTPFDTYEPNQGGFIDIPATMSVDGQEYWYFITHHGNERAQPQGRPVSLLPVHWIEGWPIIGGVNEQGDYLSLGKPCSLASAWDGTGFDSNSNSAIHHPNSKYKPGIMKWHCKKPPIKDNCPIVNFKESDAFSDNGSTLTKIWQWNHVPRGEFWSLAERPGYLRMYAFPTTDNSNNFFKIGNVICQRYIHSKEFLAEIKIDISFMENGQQAGLAHFNGGKNYASIGVYRENDINRLIYCSNKSDTIVNTNIIIFRSFVDINCINQYSYSMDSGNTYIQFGEQYQLIPAGFRGDYIGIFTYNNIGNGLIDAEYFKLECR